MNNYKMLFIWNNEPKTIMFLNPLLYFEPNNIHIFTNLVTVILHYE